MAKDDLGGIKSYLRRKFSTGGGGVSLQFSGLCGRRNRNQGISRMQYGLDGAHDHVVITQNGFEGGYATGSEACPKRELLRLIEDLINEMGFGATSIRQLMVFADYSQGLATT